MRWIPLAALFALCLGCGARESSSASDPKQSSTFVPPADWTHTELVEHLAKKGVKLETVPAGLPFSASGIPVVAMREEKRTGAPVVVSYLCKDEQAAREQAGTLGKDAFAIGRFAFGRAIAEDERDAELLKKIRAAF